MSGQAMKPNVGNKMDNGDRKNDEKIKSNNFYQKCIKMLVFEKKKNNCNAQK